jgi:glycosyltransferase involved in cell wall biosynthesis
VKPREVLVCDGGSTDGTLDILKEYPVKIVATNVRGVGSARNVLASEASGEIIAWLDSDTVIPVNWLELREKVHREHPEIDCLSAPLPVVSLKEAIEKSKARISSEMDLKPCDMVVQGGLTIKRDVIQRVGGYDPFFEWGEDWDFRTRLLRIGAGVYCTETCPSYHIRSERFVESWVRRYILLHALEPRKFILAGNFLCFLFKYGPWYIRFNPRHFVTFLLRLWLLYSLFGIVVFPGLALISLFLALLTNLVACRIHHGRLGFGFVLEQIFKALGEHRNLVRSIIYRMHKTKPYNIS